MWAAPVTFIVVLFYWPVARILALGFSGDWLSATLTSRTWHIVWFTIGQALASAAFSVILALPIALLLYCRRFSGQRFLLAAVTVPFMLPTVVVGIAFTPFEGLPPIGRIICAHLFMNVGIAVRIIGSVWHRIDTSAEEAAVLDGAGRFLVFTAITLPQLRTAIASAGALIFLYCASSFGVIMILGNVHTRTLETEIYVAATQFLDLPRTSGLSLIQTALTIGAFAVAHKYSRGRMSFAENSDNQHRTPLQPSDKFAGLLAAGIFLFLICWPLLRITQKAFSFHGSWSLQNFKNLGSFGARQTLSITLLHATFNSLRNMVLASVLALVVGTCVSYLLSRRKFNDASHRSATLLDTMFQIPVGTSAVVLGFGYLVTFSSGILPLRSSWLVTPLVQALLATPLVVRIIFPALMAIDSHVHESASIDTADSRQIWRWIEVPLIRSAISTSIAFTALVSIGEFASTSFLAYGDQATLPLVLFQLISHPGPQNYGMAMATSFLLIIGAFAIVFSVSEKSSKVSSLE